VGAIIHDPQAQAIARLMILGERHAVIFDSQHNIVSAPRKQDRNTAGLPVFDGVADGFLGNFAKLLHCLGGDLRKSAHGTKAAMDLKSPSDIRAGAISTARTVSPVEAVL